MTFYKRLGEVVKNKGKSINQIERELGYPRNSIHNYKYGAEPSGSRLIEIAHHLQISPEYLIGITEKKQYVSFLTYFNELDDEYKLKILHLALEWSETIIQESFYKKIQENDYNR